MSSKRREQNRKMGRSEERKPSRTKREVFSSFESSARKRTRAILETRPTRSKGSTIGEPVACVASPFPSLEIRDSDSPLAALYRNPTFLLEWDNDLPYHLAQSLIRLRRHRDLSQAELAERMGTSQAKIARIEGGEENVTLRTVKKVADALDGRITLTIQPSEMQLPRMPNWWDYPLGYSAAWGNQPPKFTKMLASVEHGQTTIGARWDAGDADEIVTLQVTSVTDQVAKLAPAPLVEDAETVVG
jgi:transcriptional regulator with XRE-family HTH domain